MREPGNSRPDRTKALGDELKLLRRGFGVNDPKLPETIGPLLRQVCGVQDTDPQWTARERIHNTLVKLVNRLPEPHRAIARVALGFDSEPGLRYTERLRALEQRFERDTRTIQRRSNNAIYYLAECAAEEQAAGGPRRRPGPPWHTVALRTSLVLDGSGVEVTETRRIVSHLDGLSEIEHSVTVLPPTGTAEGPLDLATVGIRAVSGGDVLSPRLHGRNRAVFILRPPEPLDEGAEHEFEFRVAVPQMSPLYVCTPTYPCDTFTLHVKFDRPPTAVWVVNGDLATEADDPTLPRETVRPDASGEVRHVFEDLEPYRSYGLLWRPVAD
ncbi:hypothetical protein L6E12_04265 [Actinokineospora sp. PR83]|uniref:hypothetical protein n=1 Tax=Actinokineospora sp. PR83 TaxID=2884908 RepID=UPI001F15A149|nr:hypothetical protein [Actinokineospora sp. PR83]MCG8915003.1 hypothetical protein [Actinokineospora sp. PR83]